MKFSDPMPPFNAMKADSNGMVPVEPPTFPEPYFAPFQRAELAAVFLSKWVDGSEQPTAGRIDKRLANAFALADLVWAKAHEVKP